MTAALPALLRRLGVLPVAALALALGAPALALGPGAAHADDGPPPQPDQTRTPQGRAPSPAALRRGKAKAWRPTRVRGPSADEATTTLSGQLFYEDHRRNGRHANRTDLAGRRGRGNKHRERPEQDYLGAYYMVVDVFEVDSDRALAPGCSPLEWVGAATVHRDGSFSATVPAEDRCRAEGADSPEYVLRARTRYCRDELCFQVGRSRANPHALWFGLDDPLVPGARGRLRPPLLFSPAGRSDKNEWARAANHYASLVDAIVSLHIYGGIPFRRDEFGPVTVRFPSRFAEGRATSPGLIDANNRGWPKGNLVIHEYGHIVHRRAWNGDYAGFHDPIQRWSGKAHTIEVPFIAFKEGWANFVTNYVTGRCFRPRYDREEKLVSLEWQAPGIHFPQNHHQLLCDWVDGRDDRRAGATVGDTAQTDILGLWTLLDQTDDRRADYPSHDPVREGLDVCDLMATHLLPAAERTAAAQSLRIRESFGLLENNDISCPAVSALFAAASESGAPTDTAGTATGAPAP